MFARVVIVLATGAVLWAALVRDTGASGAPESYRVRPGDSLWSIAASRYGGDTREGVWELQQANRLVGTTIVPGQLLVVP